ncbi:hypothetical protein PACTADRAFT_50856 [Pachysolen tannophilus NRRL Y-2460]|uniref:TLC domain-containing protein n=1 Tax=Pachysolen tannophilus NRRL Y-2460 TaxID=669874 RepID=A0A1E4TTE9_PACTA|nr:hypothetical protein PACTADRAFT_50856 [Pachysolen tannophilus NRRL Y-2460]
MPSNDKQELWKQTRLTKLEEKIESDRGLVTKIWLSFIELCSRHTWLAPFLILFATYTAYFISGNYTESNILHAFVTVSYKIPGTEPPMYGKGLKDILFVFYYMIFFTFFREFLMQVVLRPLAIKCGMSKESKVKRFMEQTYSMVYYGITGPVGLYIMYHTPLWFFETRPFYLNYPHKTHEWLFKAYYLGQAAFWAQQSVVLMLQLEAPRKDFKELVLHHIVTLLLISLSYRFHFTWMGLEIYITMDVSDFFLAMSKTLSYMDSILIGPFFFLFSGVWIYLRHYINLRILWSVLTEFSQVGDYTLNFATEQYKCWISQIIVFTLIFALHLVNAYWLALIFRIAYRYVFLDITKDERSDDESEDENEKKDQ